MGILEFVTSIVAMALGAITIWIFLLRKDRRRSRSRIEPEGKYDIRDLSTMAESMQERIDILESILDAEVPDWREQSEHRAE